MNPTNGEINYLIDRNQLPNQDDRRSEINKFINKSDQHQQGSFSKVTLSNTDIGNQILEHIQEQSNTIAKEYAQEQFTGFTIIKYLFDRLLNKYFSGDIENILGQRKITEGERFIYLDDANTLCGFSSLYYPVSTHGNAGLHAVMIIKNICDEPDKRECHLFLNSMIKPYLSETDIELLKNNGLEISPLNFDSCANKIEPALNSKDLGAHIVQKYILDQPSNINACLQQEAYIEYKKDKIKKIEYSFSLLAGIFFTAVFSWAFAGHLNNKFLHKTGYTWTGIGLAISISIISFCLICCIAIQMKEMKDTPKKVGKLNSLGLFFGMLGCGVLAISLLLNGNIQAILSYVAPLCFVVATALMFSGRQLRHLESRNPGKKYWTSFGAAFIGFQLLGAFSLFTSGLVEAGYLNKYKWMGSQSKAILGWVVIAALCLGIIGALGMTAKDTYNANRDGVIQLPTCH